MNIPFRFSTSSATPILLFDLTNNAALADIITAAISGSTDADKLTAVGLRGVTTISSFLFTGFSVTADTPCIVEFGLYKATGTKWCPLYRTYGTKPTTGGGIVRKFGSGYQVPNEVAQGTTHWNFAVKITPDSGTSVVAGDVEIDGLGI